jgi:hypothetical protein
MLKVTSAMMQGLRIAQAKKAAPDAAAEAWEAFLKLPLSGAYAVDRNAALPLLSETYVSCATYGIVEHDSIRGLMLISMLIGRDVLGMEEFLSLLNEPLLHPEAKARHILLAFAAIGRMQGR